jgi:hypothetical protein
LLAGHVPKFLLVLPVELVGELPELLLGHILYRLLG